MLHRLGYGIAALFIVLMQGCAPGAVKPGPIPLPQGSWELVSATFAEHGRIPGAARATLAFENGRLSAFSGCNTATGALGGGDGQFEVKELAVTRRGCPEPLAWFESRFFKMLRSTPSYHVDGEILVLTLGNDRARFRRVPAPRPAPPISDISHREHRGHREKGGSIESPALALPLGDLCVLCGLKIVLSAHAGFMYSARQGCCFASSG